MRVLFSRKREVIDKAFREGEGALVWRHSKYGTGRLSFQWYREDARSIVYLYRHNIENADLDASKRVFEYVLNEHIALASVKPFITEAVEAMYRTPLRRFKTRKEKRRRLLIEYSIRRERMEKRAVLRDWFNG